MSILVNGELKDDWFTKCIEEGEYIRKDSQFENWITADGKPGKTGFKAEANRYHLYISHACPWCHRTLIYLAVKNLRSLIGVSVVHPYMSEKGWQFLEYPGATLDTVNSFRFAYELYIKSISDYSGVVTVPILWDKKTIPLSTTNLRKSSACLIPALIILPAIISVTTRTTCKQK